MAVAVWRSHSPASHLNPTETVQESKDSTWSLHGQTLNNAIPTIHCLGSDYGLALPLVCDHRSRRSTCRVSSPNLTDNVLTPTHGRFHDGATHRSTISLNTIHSPLHQCLTDCENKQAAQKAAIPHEEARTYGPC